MIGVCSPPQSFVESETTTFGAVQRISPLLSSSIHNSRQVAAIPKKRRGSHMSKNNRKTNAALITLIGDLKAQSRSTGSALWRDVALRLETSRSNWAEPNLSRLSRYAANEDIVLVPGKLLGSGEVAGKPNVAAYSVSAGARSKIEDAGGRVITIRELMNENPEGAGVRILG